MLFETRGNNTYTIKIEVHVDYLILICPRTKNLSPLIPHNSICLKK